MLGSDEEANAITDGTSPGQASDLARGEGCETDEEPPQNEATEPSETADSALEGSSADLFPDEEYAISLVMGRRENVTSVMTRTISADAFDEQNRALARKVR